MNPLDYSEEYAQVYEFITQHKDYNVEVDSLKNLLESENFSKESILLSIGCGTCNHEMILAKEGYQVFATDKSNEMMKVAKKKSKKSISFFSNLEEIPKEANIQFVISLFNVVNCLNDIDELIRFLKMIYKFLPDNGGLFFESWNLYPCIKFPPQIVNREFGEKNSKNYLIRTATPYFDFVNQNIRINYLIEGNLENRLVKIKSVHNLKIFSITEIVYALQASKFSKPIIKGSLPKLQNLGNSIDNMPRMVSLLSRKICN